MAIGLKLPQSEGLLEDAVPIETHLFECFIQHTNLIDFSQSSQLSRYRLVL